MQNAAGASSGQEGDVIGLFHPQRERVAFLETNLDKLSFQHNQVDARGKGRTVVLSCGVCCSCRESLSCPLNVV